MGAALEQLLFHLFDYAGMFPPASLSFEDAIGAAERLPEQLKRPHLLGTDLVLENRHLKSISDEVIAGFGRPIKIALLGGELTQRSDSLIEEIRGFHAAQTQARITSLEFKLPEDHRPLREIISPAPGVRIAVEPKLGSLEMLSRQAEEFAQLNLTLKVRGAASVGVDTTLLAEVFKCASRAGTSLKVTAGHHHPIIEHERYDNQFGFLNTALAHYLSRQYPEISSGTLHALLDNESTRPFQGSDQLSFGGYSVTVSMLQELQAKFPFSIGSCSLTEPDEDLVRLFDG